MGTDDTREGYMTDDEACDEAHDELCDAKARYVDWVIEMRAEEERDPNSELLDGMADVELELFHQMLEAEFAFADALRRRDERRSAAAPGGHVEESGDDSRYSTSFSKLRIGILLEALTALRDRLTQEPSDDGKLVELSSMIEHFGGVDEEMRFDDGFYCTSFCRLHMGILLEALAELHERLTKEPRDDATLLILDSMLEQFGVAYRETFTKESHEEKST